MLKFKSGLLFVLMPLLLGTSFAEGGALPAHLHGQMGHSNGYPQTRSDCTDMQLWDVGMAMCMPLAMKGMPMSMLMVSGFFDGGYTMQQGPRGKNAGWSTNMVMVDAGTSIGDNHYLNVDLMLTAERWTVPQLGYPLLLQVGEENALGVPFIDAQHPHSSPIMGLTFSDTIRLGEGKNALKLYFAPRGETTEGPVAFMHRPTGMVNPDAPLGHHVGQDVGHISSTVLGASLKIDDTRFEASTFHGEEPEPSKVDLPFGAPDSVAVRVVQDLSQVTSVMASVAYVNDPEHHDPAITHVVRYSTSLYNRVSLSDSWVWDNSLIYGGIAHYDHAGFLNSFGEEFWLHNDASNIWGRIEVLQRTPAQLKIASPSENSGRWVASMTLGYTHNIATFEGATLGLGASVSKTLLPSEYSGAYGGNPWSGKIFLQLKGMRMWGM